MIEEQKNAEIEETVEKIKEEAKLRQNCPPQYIDDEEIEKGVIGVGSHVKLYDMKEDEEIEYDIVGATEADSLKGKISNESPLGKELIGKKKGDTIELPIARGKLKVEVLKRKIIKR